MKKGLKIVTLILVLAMSLGLAACGDKKAEDKVVPAADIYKAITDAIGADLPVMFEEPSKDFTDMVYEGMSGVKLEEELYYMPPVLGAGSEVAIVRAADINDVPQIEKIFNDRISVTANDEFYVENQGPWKNNSKVLSYGRTVIMICMPESIKLPVDAIDALFK